jgi:hypothetical protein
MCCKDLDDRRLRQLLKKEAKLLRQGKKLSEEEVRELHNLKVACGGLQ